MSPQMTDNKSIIAAFQQLAKALLTRPGEYRAEQSEESKLWGVTIQGCVLYEFEFSQPEAEIIAALLNWNPELDWSGITAIVALFEPGVYQDWREE